jgi:hypothetical protein
MLLNQGYNVLQIRLMELPATWQHCIDLEAIRVADNNSRSVNLTRRHI